MNNRKHPSNKKRQHDHERQNNNHPPFDMTQIVLVKNDLPADIFSRVAEDAAKHVANGRPEAKPTQLRKFYDEICMWDSKSRFDPERFTEYLPFILMLKAKVAYSKGRGHVNDAYLKILNHCLTGLEKKPEPEHLHNLKLFMEAFTGFYKVYGPKN